MAAKKGASLYHVSRENGDDVPSKVLSKRLSRTLGHSAIPQYRFTVFRSKGAAMILVWIFSSLYAAHFFMEKTNHHELLTPNTKEIDSILIFVMCMFFYQNSQIGGADQCLFVYCFFVTVSIISNWGVLKHHKCLLYVLFLLVKNLKLWGC